MTVFRWTLLGWVFPASSPLSSLFMNLYFCIPFLFYYVRCPLLPPLFHCFDCIHLCLLCSSCLHFPNHPMCINSPASVIILAFVYLFESFFSFVFWFCPLILSFDFVLHDVDSVGQIIIFCLFSLSALSSPPHSTHCDNKPQIKLKGVG